jgi:hypothetical protein
MKRRMGSGGIRDSGPPPRLVPSFSLLSPFCQQCVLTPALLRLAISVGLHAKAKTLASGVEGGPFRAVADAMEVIPRTLVQNSGGNAMRVLTELRVRVFPVSLYPLLYTLYGTSPRVACFSRRETVMRFYDRYDANTIVYRPSTRTVNTPGA